MAEAGCPLCEGAGGTLVLATPKWRLIRADEAGFPAFYRVVWNEHVREFSDLAPQDRAECMEAVTQVELALRRHLSPDKVNVASLGNMVAHLHWHVIARFSWDSRWPAPVWAAPVRDTPPAHVAEITALRERVDMELLGKYG